MRVLVAGRNAKVLATAAGAFANDLQIQTAATKAAAFALLERTEFDLIVACETLGDGSGLEVLSHVAVNSPDTLRIFAARPSTLNLLKGELGLFGLFRTLPYPINFPKLWAALSLARSTCADAQPARAGHGVKHVVLEDGWQPGRQVVAARVRSGAPVANGPTVPQGAVQRQAAVVGRATAKPRTVTTAPVAPVAPARTAGKPSPQASATPAPRTAGKPTPQAPAAPAARRPDTSGIRAAARYAAAHAEPAAPARATSQPHRAIPQSEAFKRALAKRNAARLDANSPFGPTDQIQATSQILGVPRREPGMTNDSLAQLAKLATTPRSAYNFRGAPTGKKRAALFVGSGVFAATTAAVLTFFMMNANNSMDRSKLPLLASINRPVPNKVFPWQPQAQQPTRPTTLLRSESTAPAAADLEVEAEAASENEIEPGHPGPPQPNPPPPASEPPSLDSPAEPADQ